MNYRERRAAGIYDAPGAEPEPEPEAPLPRTHAALDEAAAEEGVTWSDDSLSVADKQAELEAARTGASAGE